MTKLTLKQGNIKKEDKLFVLRSNATGKIQGKFLSKEAAQRVDKAVYKYGNKS